MPIPAPLALYIHWPFCLSKCPYCDFNSHVSASVDHARWRAALRRELRHYADQTQGRPLTSIFFGGGTPSLMEAATVAALIEDAGQFWPTTPDIEITLEANPTSVEAQKFIDFRAAGVNRVSLGIQSLRAADLAFLGRQHNVAEARTAITLARTHFPRFSFDLIYARPGQTLEMWDAELGEALSEGPSHLSLYQLTIEQGTAFAAKGVPAAEENLAADLYEATDARMQAAGLPAYEISNYARPGHESRHNLTYWHYGDYIGIGPGAHGRLTLGGTKHASGAHRSPTHWLEEVEKTGCGAPAPDPLDPDTVRREALMMGLRLTDGISNDHWQALTGQSLPDSLSSPTLTRLIEGGFLAQTPQTLKATPQGRLCLNGVLAKLLDIF
jgi:putative oxygen-independent coproporphyrinogen III oxidase